MAKKVKIEFVEETSEGTTTRLADDTSGLGTVGKTVAGVVVTAAILGGAYVAAPAVMHEFQGQPNKTPGADVDVLETGHVYKITPDEFKGLSHNHKDPFGQGKFLYGEFQIDDAKAMHGVVKMEADGKIVDQPIEIVDPAQTQAFLEDLVHLGAGSSPTHEVHVAPAQGNIVLTGQNATNYALNVLGMKDAGNVDKVIIKADRDYVAGSDKSIGAAKVYTKDGAGKPMMLDAKQIDAAVDIFENGVPGDLAKLTQKYKVNGKEQGPRVARIGGFDVQAYVKLSDFAENTRGLGDQWNNSLEQVLTNIEQSFTDQDAKAKADVSGAFISGSWDSVYKLAVDVANLTGIDAANITAKLNEFNASKDRAGAVAYLTSQVRTWGEAKDDGLVDPKQFEGYVPGSKVTDAEQAILKGWRNNIASTYSNVSGVNYLTKLNITPEQVDASDASGLWNLSQKLKTAVASDGELEDFRVYVGAKTHQNVTDMNTSQLRDLLGEAGFSDYVFLKTGKRGSDHSELETILNGYIDGLVQADGSYADGYTAGQTDTLIQQGNADALVVSAGSNGAKLDGWLDLLGQAGRCSFTFDHTTTGTDAYNNFTAYLKANNVSMPTNLSSKYNDNRYNFSITDTVGGGSLMNFYNKDGNLLTTETKILTPAQTGAAKSWAKDYGVWSGSKGDE